MDDEGSRPIGYWLKELDRLIEAAFERALAGEGLSRRHWQVMNVLAAGPRDPSGLTAALRPFWGDGAMRLDEVTAELEARRWVTRDDGGGALTLTAAGRAAHAAVAERVDATRRAAADGVTRDEYLATVAVLRRMAGNLARAAG